jgi:hypothetical protein
MWWRPPSSAILKHDPFNLLLGKHTGLSSTAGHLPLEQDKLLLLMLCLIGSHHATEQVARGRPFALRETFVLPREAGLTENPNTDVLRAMASPFPGLTE